MPRGDWDPLAEIAPPRYAYESDDEDETGLADSATGNAPEVEITILPSSEEVEGKKHQGCIIIVATGRVGVVWARGAKLGEQVGQINVNRHAIGHVFRPSWAGQETESIVVVSETFVRLPVWSMSQYAAAILERWKPTKVVLLDAYSTATYITTEPIPHHEAPLRYLSTDRKLPSPNIPMSLFAPPNLLQSTTAAFLNLLALPRPTSRSQEQPTGIAILVPSRRAPLPTPRSLSREETDDTGEESGPVTLATLLSPDDSEDWDPMVLHDAHQMILQITGDGRYAEEWADARGARELNASRKLTGRRRMSEAEEGMYI